MPSKKKTAPKKAAPKKDKKAVSSSAPARPEIRRDYIQEKYVIIAPKRSARPHDVEMPIRKKPVKAQKCVFCPENINSEPDIMTIGPADDWSIKVLANKFPAISVNNSKAYGIQEVVIETPDHAKELHELPTSYISSLLEVYAIRTKDISKNKKIQYILMFKNNGGKAGASLIHSHSQIFATEFLPPHLRDKSVQLLEYKLSHGTCGYCDVIKKESKGPRLIYKDEYVIAFCPYASMHNYEVWIMPIRHLDNITLLDSGERYSWAKILKHVLKKINRLGLPYNYYFHQVIFDEDQHLYMKIKPRGSVWAGVEIGSGLIINPIAPEDAAEYYRDGAPD